MTQTTDETLTAIVLRIAYHNDDDGWSVLRVQLLDHTAQEATVIVHQVHIVAGSTMAFKGQWVVNPKHGRQFKAVHAIEQKPATSAAIEKYLGSGLIKGVGPKIAQKIVCYFKKDTFDIFDHAIERLTEVPGIARKKLATIQHSWKKHSAIKDVMLFLQQHGVSTLFAVRIYKQYGDRAISVVQQDPYQLCQTIYGIGFVSADKVALQLGLAVDCEQRIIAAINYVLAGSRDRGHCYLTMQQIQQGVQALIKLDVSSKLDYYLRIMHDTKQLCTRELDNNKQPVYYAKALFHAERTVAMKLKEMVGASSIDHKRVEHWLQRYCQKNKLPLSDEQIHAVQQIAAQSFSVLTGGPGCGKTTTVVALVRLLEAMHKTVLLAAPTGRAAQRMNEVINRDAKTIHRLLVWYEGGFQRNEHSPLQADFLIIDECSMLDISLSAALLQAVPSDCQVLFIGDADQLPSVGAGNVLQDLLACDNVPSFRLTQIFRQASQSTIIRYAHQINQGEMPHIPSPFKQPSIWRDGADCLFIDSDEATHTQLSFIQRVNRFFNWKIAALEKLTESDEPYQFRTQEALQSAYENDFTIPPALAHVKLDKVYEADTPVDAFKAVIKNIHPWSSLHYGLSCSEVIVKLYTDWLPKYYANHEIQLLTPMNRGSLGAANLNAVIQQALNPPATHKSQLDLGDKHLREGDRVIHKKNNYNLNVFNGDIGRIVHIDPEAPSCHVVFQPDNRAVTYDKEAIVELDLAYAITIHKSQGSEFPVVIIPLLTQHFNMLYRNLIYTALTRAKHLAIFVGSRRALAMAIKRQDRSQRQTALTELLSAR